MIQVQDGQCGVCAHFGEHQSTDAALVQIRTSHKAPENFIEPCELPRNAAVNLKVTATSGCDGFEPARPELS